ncbi:hypothetical protein D3C72_2066060 [compost metagenome]
MRHIRLAYDSRFIRPENARFLTTNTFAVRSQPVDMIQCDAGDHRNIGINHIGGIKTPAETDFQDHYVQLRLLKEPQRRERAVLEIR